MSFWTHARDAVTGTVAPIVNTVAGAIPGGGGLMGLLGGGGLGGLFGGQQGGGSMMAGGGFTGGFGSGTDGQYGSLMDMLGQRYQKGQIGQTGMTDFGGQGLA